jgi:hypothetical protein
MLSARVLSRSYMHGVMPQWALAGLKAEPKVLALVRARFLWHFLYLERAQGVLEMVPGGTVGPPGTP